MAKFTMTQKAANDYMNAIAAALELKRIGNKKKVDNLIKSINRMYHNQLVLSDNMTSEDDIAELEIPSFMTRRIG